MNQVFRVLTWSFNAAFQGLNPSTGPMGGALCGEALRRAGTPLTAGFHKFCLCELRGDWEWHVCIWRPTSSWVSKNVCFKCGALSSGTPEMLYHNTGAPGEVRCRWIEEEYTHDQFIARGLKDTNLCNLTRMGWSNFHVFVWHKLQHQKASISMLLKEPVVLFISGCYSRPSLGNHWIPCWLHPLVYYALLESWHPFHLQWRITETRLK